jgi:hypothetical protein
VRWLTELIDVERANATPATTSTEASAQQEEIENENGV